MTAMISLQQIEKRYPGTAAPAVDALSLDIEDGETVALVGPSGCGKTTTLKMINRLIEPTGGPLLLDGTDVLERDPVELRRGIGYVIQHTGLMPHRTIRQNIATVPKLLGWDDARASLDASTNSPRSSTSTPSCSTDTRPSSPAASDSASAWREPWPPTRP